MAYTSYGPLVADYDGEKPPIIVMHGLFGNKSDWHDLSEAIRKTTRRKVIAPDARNHGESPHTEELDYDSLTEDLKHFMEELNVKKASFIGHSMGGRTIMYFAVLYPELVESLTIVDISPINSRDMNDIQSIVKALRRIDLNINAPLPEVRKLADEYMKSFIGSPVLRQFLLTNIIQADNTFRWRVNLESIYRNVIPHLSYFPPVQSKFHGPTYFIAGGNSTFLDPADHEDIRQIFPSAHFDYIPGAGHWLHAGRPNEFLKLVTQFFSTL